MLFKHVYVEEAVAKMVILHVPHHSHLDTYGAVAVLVVE
jgi:hypothetical protein